MISPAKSLLTVAAMFLTATLTQAAAISVNSTCELGTCTSAGTLAPGQSISTSTFSFTYMLANTDNFLITGSYSASSAAPSISFQANATYLGNSTGTASAADVLSVDLLQNFSYTNDPDGTYSESATLSQGNVAAGSYVTAELSFGGQGIGLLGPYSGTGSQTYTDSSTLSGLPNPSLADFNYTFHLAAGSPAVPEPADAGLLAVGLLAILVPALRRRAGRVA